MNTIILKRGYRRLSIKEHLKFQNGDTIFGENCFDAPEEIKRWDISEKEDALKELAKYKCTYRFCGGDWEIEEYALEFCEVDDDGEFLKGSDYYLAETKEE